MLLRVLVFCLALVHLGDSFCGNLCRCEYVGEYDDVITNDGRVTSYSDDVINDALSQLAGKVLVTCPKSPVTSSRDLDFYSNVTIKFKQVQFYEGSVAELEVLKDKPWISTVGFEGCNVRKLDWNHLPQSCRKIFIDNDQVEFTNGDGNNRIKSLKFDRIVTMEQLPANLPQFLQQLVILGENGYSRILSKIGSTSNHWPPHLSLLYLANTFIHDLNFLTSTNYLQHLSMVDNNFNNSNEITVNHLPPSLNTLHLQGCRLENIKFTSSHSNLFVVGLSGNLFTNIPQSLPPSLRKLIMSNNKIVQFARDVFRPFSSLTTLFLNHNLLEKIPDYLPDNLVELNLAYNRIEFVTPNLFLGKNKLKTLDISHNKLQFMIANLPSSLEQVYMENNQLGWVDAEYYEFCVNCSIFNLMYNPLICDERFIFMLHWFQTNVGANKLMADDRNCDSNQDIKGYVSLQFLEELSAAFTKANCSYSLNTVKCGILFQERFKSIAEKFPPRFLEILKINDNRDLDSFPENIYVDQDNLKIIDFDRNGLTEIPRKLPGNLRVLKLRDNNVDSITEENIRNFQSTSKLKELYLSGNSFKTIYDYQLQPLAHLEVIAFDHNQLVCDCDIFSLRTFFDANVDIRHQVQTLYSLQCSSPQKEKGKSFFQFTQDYGGEKCVPDQCSYEIYKPTITCPYYNNETVIPNASYWQTINLTGANLRHSLLRLKNLSPQVLIASNASLTRVPARGLPSSLRTIILDNNRIETLPDRDIREDLPNLEFLDLSYNNIKVIPRSWLNMLAVTKFEGNPLVCDCQVLPVYQWTLSNSEHVSNNFESLSCGEPENLRGVKVMELEKDVFCVKTNVELIVVATLIPIFSILLFSFLTNVYIHKKRRKEEREGIIKAFKSLLVNEEVGEDGVMTSYQYDAFISYENNDHKFVTRLLQEMEDVRRRKFCFHERDFKAGKSFSDNIVELVEQSSRVITIISRNYAKSSWCQYEVQIALTDMHEKRKKKFLIPILLQDVTKDEEVKGSLKTILSVITALSVPNSNHHTSDEWKDFWDKLDSVLP